MDKLRDSLVPTYLRSYSSTIAKWLLLGYLVRLLLMPILVQSDLINNGFQAAILSSQGYWLPTAGQPLYFYIYAGWLRLFQPIMPFGIYWDIPFRINFGTYSNQWSTALILRLSDPNTYNFLFISKALFLIPDFVAAFAILHLYDKPSEGLFAFKFWIMNPILIFVTYIIGQFDVFVAVFLTLSLVAFYRKKYISSAVFLGLGAAFKIFLVALVPLVLLPLAQQKHSLLKFRNTVAAAVLSFLPFVLSYLSLNLIPVHTASYDLSTYNPAFSIFGLFLDRTITLTTISGFNDYFFVFVFFYFCFVFVYYLKGEFSYDSFWRYALCIFLFYFAFSFFHVQWFLWVQPLIIIAVTKYRRLFPVYLATLVGFAGYLLYFDASLTTYLLMPLYSGVISWQTPTQLLTNAALPPTMVIGIFRTLLSAGCIGIAVFILWRLLIRKDELAN